MNIEMSKSASFTKMISRHNFDDSLEPKTADPVFKVQFWEFNT